jgi:hypothetical protein
MNLEKMPSVALKKKQYTRPYASGNTKDAPGSRPIRWTDFSATEIPKVMIIKPTLIF